MENLSDIVLNFNVKEVITDVKPLGEGLINDTFRVFVEGNDTPKYVLQRINNAIFQDVDMLQDNIEKVTNHIRKKLIEKNENDIDRKVLNFIKTKDGKNYYFDGEKYWRLMVFINDSFTYQAVTPEYSYTAGLAFGEFQSMLSDIEENLGETIPSFHNIELRLNQLKDAVEKDAVGRVKEVRYYLDEIEKRAEAMCLGEQLHREGKLPKRICHCDTKVNNMLFDKDGKILCVIDLDTVMPSFIFSDFGDFLRSAANTTRISTILISIWRYLRLLPKVIWKEQNRSCFLLKEKICHTLRSCSLICRLLDSWQIISTAIPIIKYNIQNTISSALRLNGVCLNVSNVKKRQ